VAKNRLLWMGLSLLGTASLAVLFQNCGQGFSTSNNLLGLSSSQSAANGGTSLSPKFAATADPSAAMNLGTAQTLNVTVNPSTGFTGGVDLSLSTASLAASDPAKNVTVALNQTHLNLAAGQPLSVSLTLTVPPSTPTLNTAVDVTVTESSPANGAAPFTTTIHVPVKVVAVYEILITGGASAQESWSAPKVVNFATHPEGITVRYINNGTVAHEVHSSGNPIPHEGGPLPIGGQYETLVTEQTPTSDVYYCHSHENGGTAARTLNFNATAAATKPPPSGNPNASYRYLAANILPKCTSCHSGATPASGIDLSSYAAITGSAASVIPYNALSSGIYVETANGKMPVAPAPGLSAAELQDIKDWVNDGAPNN